MISCRVPTLMRASSASRGLPGRPRPHYTWATSSDCRFSTGGCAATFSAERRPAPSATPRRTRAASPCGYFRLALHGSGASGRVRYHKRKTDDRDDDHGHQDRVHLALRCVGVPARPLVAAATRRPWRAGTVAFSPPIALLSPPQNVLGLARDMGNVLIIASPIVETAYPCPGLRGAACSSSPAWTTTFQGIRFRAHIPGGRRFITGSGFAEAAAAAVTLSRCTTSLVVRPLVRRGAGAHRRPPDWRPRPRRSEDDGPNEYDVARYRRGDVPAVPIHLAISYETRERQCDALAGGVGLPPCRCRSRRPRRRQLCPLRRSILLPFWVGACGSARRMRREIIVHDLPSPSVPGA